MNSNLSNLNGARILITGGLGFIGSNIALACVQHGAIVTVYDNLDPHSGGNLHNIVDIRDVIRHQTGSISDFGTISAAVQNQDVVINCAASTSHPFSMEDPWLNSDANSRGAINLLEAIKRFNRDVRIIHIGTTTQLGHCTTDLQTSSIPSFHWMCTPRTRWSRKSTFCSTQIPMI